MKPVTCFRRMDADYRGSTRQSSLSRLGCQKVGKFGLLSGDIFCTMTVSRDALNYFLGFRWGEDGINPQMTFR